MDRNQDPSGAVLERELGSSATRYTVEQKLEYLREFAASEETLRGFREKRRLNTRSFCRWRKLQRTLGDAGLIAQPNPGNRGGTSGRKYGADERRALVEAFLSLHLPQHVFAKSYGVSVGALGRWLRLYKAHGPKGLEPQAPGRKPGSVSKASLPTPLKDEIVRTQRRAGRRVRHRRRARAGTRSGGSGELRGRRSR